MASQSSTRYSIPLLPTLISKKEGVGELNAEIKGGFFVENPPYKIDTLFFIGTPKALCMYLKAKLHIVFDGEGIDFMSTSGLTIPMNRKDGSSFILIWMPRFDFTPTTLSPLVHEIIHATIYILKLSGIKSKIFNTDEEEDADDEGIANAADTMFENIMDKMSKRFLSQNRSVKKRKLVKKC